MKLKLKEVVPLLNALRALDGLLDHGELRPFTFSFKVTWDKKKDIGLLQKEAERMQAVRTEKQTQYAGGRGREVPADKIEEAARDWEAFLETELDLPLLAFTVADLNVYDKQTNPDGNKIASSILAALDVLISEKPQS